MFRVRRLTLLIIPEEGGRTHEFKIPRIFAWLAGLGGIALLFLLGAGFIAISKEQDLQRLVSELEREKGVLKEDLGLLTELEVLLKDLEQSNGQLRRVLSERPESSESSSPSRGGTQIEHYVPSVDRLLAGLVRTVPTLWPVRGVPVGGAFSPSVGGIIVAAPIGSLVRASAAGTVLRAGYNLKLGYAVVLDHGNRLSTEYGYNTTILVEAGEFVQKGQPLALSGSGVDVNQPGLFFSVYENGKPRNPLAYRIWL